MGEIYKVYWFESRILSSDAGADPVVSKTLVYVEVKDPYQVAPFKHNHFVVLMMQAHVCLKRNTQKKKND